MAILHRDHEAVVFDLYGTLTSWDRETSRQALSDELADMLGADRSDFRRELRASFTDRVTGRMGDTRSTLACLVRRLNSPSSEAELSRAVERRLEHHRYLVAPTPEALSVLADLRTAGRRIGILSDCSSETPELWPTLPYHQLVDAAVFSYNLGVRKPNTRMYSAIAEALNVEPANCLYVGDGSSNELSGAQSAGMTAVMLDGCPDRDLQYDRDEGWSGSRITTLGVVTE